MNALETDAQVEMWRSMVDGPLKVCVHRIRHSARALGRRCRSIDVAADIRYLSVCRHSVSVVDFAFFLASGMLAAHHRYFSNIN